MLSVVRKLEGQRSYICSAVTSVGGRGEFLCSFDPSGLRANGLMEYEGNRKQILEGWDVVQLAVLSPRLHSGIPSTHRMCFSVLC